MVTKTKSPEKSKQGNGCKAKTDKSNDGFVKTKNRYKNGYMPENDLYHIFPYPVPDWLPPPKPNPAPPSPVPNIEPFRNTPVKTVEKKIQQEGYVLLAFRYTHEYEYWNIIRAVYIDENKKHGLVKWYYQKTYKPTNSDFLRTDLDDINKQLMTTSKRYWTEEGKKYLKELLGDNTGGAA